MVFELKRDKFKRRFSTEHRKLTNNIVHKVSFMDFVVNDQGGEEIQYQDLKTNLSSELKVVEDDDDGLNKSDTVVVTEEDAELNDIENDLDDWVDDEEEDGLRIKSFFDDSYFPSVESFLEHDIQCFKFDLRHLIQAHFHDDISVIKLINFIRSQVLALPSSIFITDTFIEGLIRLVESKEFLRDDVYMKPVIDGDPLLYLYEDILVITDDA